MKKHLLVIALVFFGYTAHSQILISILLGDKLNSGKIEFGLDGGVNFATIQGLDEAKSSPRFNLGFYFDLKLFKNPSWMLNTGVIVKSTMGASELPVYSLNNPDLDSSFATGQVQSTLHYFNVPILMKYQFKNRIFIKGGIMLGLRYKAFDEFTNTVSDDDDLQFTLETRDNYHPIDAGGLFGIGYRLMGGNGMNLGVQYYQGFVDISINDDGSNQYNRAFYATVGIPIGKAKATKD